MKRKNAANVILGILLGLYFAFWIIWESKVIRNYIYPGMSSTADEIIGGGSVILAVLVFLLVLKRFASLKNQNLFRYFIFSIVVSAFAMMAVVYFGALLFVKIDILYGIQQMFESSKLGKLILYNVPFVIYIGLAFVFGMVFALLLRKKIHYIQYISKEIKNIENEGVGRELEVQGNDEITELCKSINAMSLELKRKEEHEKNVEKNKNELITNMSHDLRSPLTSIMGYVDLLKQDGFTDQEKCSQYIEVVERRLKGLNSMINELFEFTKLNAADIKLELVQQDMISLLNHIVEENKILFGQKGLRLEKDICKQSFQMKLDMDKMVRAIQNLLDNARKYADDRKEILISARVEDLVLTIKVENQVKDAGNLNVDELFERFYKGDTARSQTDSSGLGLPIVKRIVELHGGTIKATLTGETISFEMEFRKDSI